MNARDLGMLGKCSIPRTLYKYPPPLFLPGHLRWMDISSWLSRAFLSDNVDLYYLKLAFICSPRTHSFGVIFEGSHCSSPLVAKEMNKYWCQDLGEISGCWWVVDAVSSLVSALPLLWELSWVTAPSAHLRALSPPALLLFLLLLFLLPRVGIWFVKWLFGLPSLGTGLWEDRGEPNVHTG